MRPLPTMLIAAATTIMVSSFGFAQSPQGPAEGNVLTYHGAADRSGTYKVPGLTWERAKSVHLDETFRPHITGHVYAQPLYWRPQGSELRDDCWSRAKTTTSTFWMRKRGPRFGAVRWAIQCLARR